MRGRLIYLMGPSGSGKDSLLEAARERLAARDCVIARRVITRSAEAVGEDAILTARILQAVNASTHGLSRRIADIERAILILGLNTVRNLAIISSAERFFQPRREAGRFRSLANELWRHATTTASAAKLLAMELPEPHPYLTSEEFYVMGLIHDVGIMAELYGDRDRLIDALERVQPLDDIARATDSAQASSKVITMRSVDTR